MAVKHVDFEWLAHPLNESLTVLECRPEELTGFVKRPWLGGLFLFDHRTPWALFEFASEFKVPKLQRPCNARFEWGYGHAVIPALEGPVGVVDQDNKLVSLIDV